MWHTFLCTSLCPAVTCTTYDVKVLSRTETSNNKMLFLLLSLNSRRVRLNFKKTVNWYNNDDVKIFINSVRVDCQDWNMQGNFSEDGMYWLDPDGGSHSNAFLGYCDMTSYNGGWTMCYTTDEFAKPSTEVEYKATFPYGTDGYRTNCNQIKVSGCTESIKNPFSSW